jgi:hypothetical protein
MEGYLEAAMVGRNGVGQGRNEWLAWGFSAAGIGLILVELKACVEYVQASLQQNLADMIGWLPALGMMTMKVAQQSAHHWETLEFVLRMMPLAVLPFLLAGVGIALKQRATK